MSGRFVVKVGSSVVATPSGHPDESAIDGLATEVVQARKLGDEVLLVASGASQWGRALPVLRDEFPIEDNRSAQRGIRRALLRRRILASVGQSILMSCYDKAFSAAGCNLVQFLVTREDLAEQARYESLRSVAANVLNLGLIPVFSENGLMSSIGAEIRGTDELSCLLATALQADRLVMLTSVDGMYDRSPETPGARLLPLLTDLDDQSVRGIGITAGVRSKLEAARLVTGFAIEMLIVNGRSREAIRKALQGDASSGTRFPARGRKVRARKSWVALAASSRGEIVVSSFLGEVLAAGKPASILLIGVEAVIGSFQNRDVVTVKDLSGRTLGRGEVRMSAEDLRAKLEQRRAGHEVSCGMEVVHCDYFVIAPRVEARPLQAGVL